jgi:hypothetical protein
VHVSGAGLDARVVQLLVLVFLEDGAFAFGGPLDDVGGLVELAAQLFAGRFELGVVLLEVLDLGLQLRVLFLELVDQDSRLAAATCSFRSTS